MISSGVNAGGEVDGLAFEKVREAHVGLVVLGHVLASSYRVRKPGNVHDGPGYAEEVIGVAEALAENALTRDFAKMSMVVWSNRAGAHLAGDDRFQMRV